MDARLDITNLPEINDGETAEEYRKRMNEEHRRLQARIKYLEFKTRIIRIAKTMRQILKNK